jgi:hypothetical protein
MTYGARLILQIMALPVRLDSIDERLISARNDQSAFGVVTLRPPALPGLSLSHSRNHISQFLLNNKKRKIAVISLRCRFVVI